MNTSKNHPGSTELDRDFLLNAAFSFGLRPCEFKVYFHLVGCANLQGKIAESIDKIASACNLNRKTVMQALNTMLSLGMLRRITHTRLHLYQLTMPSEWVKRFKKVAIQKTGFSPQVQKTDCAVQETDCETVQKTDCAVQETDCETVQKTDLRVVDSSKPPLKGVCHESNQLPVQQADYSPPVQQMDEPRDLDSKLAAARGRGWIAGIYWNDQREQMVTVNRFTIPVAQFMERSLDAFDCASQWCADGAARIWEVLRKIKGRSRGSLIPNTQ